MEKVRVIVVSNDINFKSAIVTMLRSNPDLELISNCFDIQSIPGSINSMRANVLILDIERIALNEAFLKNLIQKYNLTIFSVGKNPAFNLAKAGISIFMNRPDKTIFSQNVFVRDATNRINTYASRTVVGQNEMRDTVDSNTRIIAIASSTGGTEALIEVLKGIPPNCPPILIVQHMPSMFTRQYADRIDKLCQIKIKEASDGEYIKKGSAYIAPGDFHMKLIKKNSRLAVECFYAEKMHGVRPAADVLFNSMVPIVGGNMVGVILTGMGSDGARGLYELHMKGAKVIGQNKETCVVYGMPKAAFDLGAVDFQLPLDQIGSKLMALVR